MAYKKEPFPQAPQVGDHIKYNGKFIEVYSINPDDGTFLIDTGGRFPIEFSGEDWDVYR
jgi:hypothetical protein